MTFPDWYLKQREKAKKELKFAKSAKYGVDIPLQDYLREGQEAEKIDKLEELDKSTQERLEIVGERADEQFRSASYLQQDNLVTYLKIIKKALPKGVVVMSTDEAIKEFSWLKDYYFKIIPPNLNKYTTFINAYSKGGIFVWVKKGVSVEFPVQACFYTKSSNYVQIPHNFIIAEPYSKIHLLSGCVPDKKCTNSVHIAATEVHIKEGAEVSFTMLHNWNADSQVRSNVGIKVEKGATCISNYLLSSEVKNLQMYPTAILERDARAVFNTMLFCCGKSQVDAGSAIYFNGEGSRGEVKTRALILDNSRCFMRGNLSANKKCFGHLECRGLILSKNALGKAYPNLSGSQDAELTHEASMAKIKQEELNYLMTRGFSKDEAVSLVARGFIDLDIPGLPPAVNNYIKRVIESTTKRGI